MRITRPRATSLSQIRINTDLDMGAHNILLGAGQTVDGRDVSGIEEGAQKNVWQLIDSYIDINTGTVFSWDETFTAYDFLKIIFHISEQAAASGDLSLILNNVSGNVYDYESVYSPEHVSSDLGHNRFILGAYGGGEHIFGEILIRGRAAADNANPTKTTIDGRVSGYPGQKRIFGGRCALDANTVTRAAVYTSVNATGHLLLYGSNL